MFKDGLLHPYEGEDLNCIVLAKDVEVATPAPVLETVGNSQ